ncbi:pirin-related protein [Leucobacter sp. 7(1)]|uniref:pirin family protein n=1 Tax=Leucobacter sp. 7(1) TaxID=1255613 RepID=UPI00097F2C17|nr:pirin family protein [Leucobacter sp. 7(1)]SJN10024.1 pirin-related protein [Leucobacter sp. 7(1)]
MSNPEQGPEATLCADAESADSALQLIEPREVPLGGIRAMTVRRTLPQRARSFIGAWCFLDHYGPDDVSRTGGMDVAAHPHIGLQTASWLFSGEIEHRDSAGFHAFVRPGELNLMTAGRGISHSERSTERTTVLHGAQLWIALPEHAADIAPDFTHYEPPVITGLGWDGQVFLGSLLGSTSPVQAHSPLLGAELRLEPGARIGFPVDVAYEHGVLVDTGDVTLTRIAATGGAVSELPLAQDHLGFAPPGAATLQLTAGSKGARVLVLGGEPMREELIMWWNFVARSHDEILQARAEWQATAAAAGVADPSGAAHPQSPISAPGPIDPDRFGLPEHEPDPPLPAPAAPVARLVPRTQ